MEDYRKALPMLAYLLEYPDAHWRTLFPEYRQALDDIKNSANRQILSDFFDYVEGIGFNEYEEEYVRSFDFSQNTNLYLTMHDRTDFGKQANEMVVFKQMFLHNGFDLSNELPDFLPAILELAAALDEKEAFAVLDFSRSKIELLRSRLEEAKLPHASLLDVVLKEITRMEEV